MEKNEMKKMPKWTVFTPEKVLLFLRHWKSDSQDNFDCILILLLS